MSWENAREAFLRRVPTPLAVALDLVQVEPPEDGAIRGAQIWAIVRLTPIAMTASCLNAIIFLVTCAGIGAFRPELWLWAFLIFALAAYYGRNWLSGRRFEAGRSASRRALRRAVLNGVIFGALWGAVPAAFFPGAPPPIQLLIGVLTAGMMCAGGFVLAPVPLAGTAYVAAVAVGSAFALLRERSMVDLGLAALLLTYTAVVITNLSWSAALFVSSRLAEVQLRSEVIAREQAQARAAHAERMTALGELAGGIAHDFNNVMQVVSGGVGLIDRHSEQSDYVRLQAQRIEAATERGREITRRLLAFARRDVLRAEVIDAADVVRETRDLLARTIGPSIAIRIDVVASTLGIASDRRQLETVLLNLATNARDAMPRGGTLTLSATSQKPGDDREAPHLPPGRYVRLSVADTGEGMDAVTLKRAAEPFFTTKPRGRGTGLGLSMAKGFAEQSGGALAIASEPGRGCAVTIWLPQAQGVVATAGPAEKVPIAVPPTGQRVLVVDDDDVVREMLMASLEDAGFQTVGAQNAGRALMELDSGVKIDALVTDLSMPGMSGWDLVCQVQTQWVDLPTIMLTGHVGDLPTEPADRPRTERFLLLQKPVSPAQLAERLATLLVTDAA